MGDLLGGKERVLKFPKAWPCSHSQAGRIGGISGSPLLLSLSSPLVFLLFLIRLSAK